MTSLRERIDPLIEERAPWLFRNTLWAKMAKPVLDKTLSYERSLEIGERLDPMTSEAMMVELADMLAKRVTLKGLTNVPASGAALIVANHPTGIADAIMLNHAISPVRTDAYYYANADIMKVMPQFATMIAPVEWRLEKRSHAKTRETMKFTREAVEQGRLGVIFPAGRLAKRKGLRLYERPWMASAAMIARKFDLPIIPVNIRARNSSLFYLFDFLHPTLRDITLFYETLNKDRQPYHIEIGEPISASSLPKNSDEGIEILKREVIALGEPNYTLVSSKMRPAFQLF
ncbi:1-acyl-sn-glycerol-3-phosphate acyltransferase [Shimia ponticola]|uniref:1-acyl-sn-glycerol-3-phosphate acyltransferase n=1 Tax=Shimia ponticola TaxID=2582893 RepID=UPI0011BD4D37|nr:1-acyl-sn-glycerol-3-phosphate acyltransferase [Shimia ponticola]